MIPNSLGSSPELVRLQSFRETLYSDVLTRQQDALFELLDALLDLGPACVGHQVLMWVMGSGLDI